MPGYYGKKFSYYLTQALTWTGIQSFSTSIKADTINEYTSAAGVTADSVLLKDGYASAIQFVVTAASTAALTAAQCKNSWITNYGQAAENTQTLPTCAAGLCGVVKIETAGAGAFHLKAGASDKIYLNGTALDDADKISLAAPAVGDKLQFYAIQTGASAWDWVVLTENGLWIDGGV